MKVSKKPKGSQKKKDEGDLLFVKLENPSNLRRKLLESSKEVIESLRKYESLKSIRDEKAESVSRLRTDIGGIISLMAKLKRSLPKVDVKIEKDEEFAPKKEEIIPKFKPKERTELEKLESELQDIEGKLNSIS